MNDPYLEAFEEILHDEPRQWQLERERTVARRYKWNIFLPDDIRSIWGENNYVDRPVFQVNGRAYYVKTCSLKLTITASALAGPRENWFREMQRLAKAEIDRLKFTHIHAVCFCQSPCVNPQTLEQRHFALVRGATVKNN